MAEKQFARSDADNFAGLAEDDPLSELARIVGYDARPAVETLKELQRHQETVKLDPPFDLEEELLREFDRYAGAEPEAPAIEPVSVPAAAAAEPARRVEQAQPAEPVEPQFAAVEPVAEAAAPVEEDPSDFFDLAHELELSMRAETAPQANADEEPVFDAPAFDMSVFDDIDIAEAPPVVAAAEPVETRRDTPLFAAAPAARVEPSFEQPTSFTAARPEVVTPPAPVSLAVSEPELSEIDKLLADVARFPVPPVSARPAEQPVVQAEPAVPGKKQNYPFTPVFSRATPVAGAGGPRSYTAPAAAEQPVVTPHAEAAPVAAAVVAAAAAIPVAAAEQPVIQASEPEPDFDLANFERELSNIHFDIEPFDAPASPSGAPVLESIFRIDPQEFEEPEVVAEEPVDDLLPFDASMISENEDHPSPIAEMDVPALPVHEPEVHVTSHADFDLDLDAEMAQLFAEHQAAPAAQPAVAEPVAVAANDLVDGFPVFGKATGAMNPLDFPVEEDMRRSFDAQRAQFDAATTEIEPFNFEAYGAGEPVRVENGRSRVTVYAAAAAVLLLLGGAGVYAWMGGSDAALTAEGPKVILADKDPVKIVPEEKGGKTVPNQDKAVYDRVAGTQGEAPRQDALVTTKEEPLDVVQRTLTPETLPLQGEDEGAAALATPDAQQQEAENRLLPDGADAATGAKEEQTPAVAPRKVRTMIVKPDGTLVAREETVPAPAETQTLPAETNVALAAPATTVQELAPATADASQPLTANTPATATTPEAAAANPAVATTTDAAASVDGAVTAPIRSVETTEISPNTPIPQMRPAEQPVNVVGTVTENGNLRPTTTATAQEVAAATPQQTATAAATTTVAPGTYVMQIASVPSEADAQKTYNSLSSKFGGVIGGRGVDIKQAEIPGKGTFYRIRVPVGTRDEANQLCARYKSAGGSCLVTR